MQTGFFLSPPAHCPLPRSAVAATRRRRRGYICGLNEFKAENVCITDNYTNIDMGVLIGINQIKFSFFSDYQSLNYPLLFKEGWRGEEFC